MRTPPGSRVMAWGMGGSGMGNRGCWLWPAVGVHCLSSTSLTATLDPMTSPSNPFGSRGTLQLGTERATVYRLPELARQGVANLDRLPFSIRVLLENALRHAGRGVVGESHVRELAGWTADASPRSEIPFMP